MNPAFLLQANTLLSPKNLTLEILNWKFEGFSSPKSNFAVLIVLDKVNSQSDIIEIDIGKEYIFKNLSINILKCNNSKFDDDPEVTAYMQVKDIVNIDENKVYIFNDWTFASSPSIRPFDHPVYDIWLKNCYS